MSIETHGDLGVSYCKTPPMASSPMLKQGLGGGSRGGAAGHGLRAWEGGWGGRGGSHRKNQWTSSTRCCRIAKLVAPVTFGFMIDISIVTMPYHINENHLGTGILQYISSKYLTRWNILRWLIIEPYIIQIIITYREHSYISYHHIEHPTSINGNSSWDN